MKRSSSFDAAQDLRRTVRRRPNDLPQLYNPTTPDNKHKAPLQYPPSTGTSIARSSSPLSSAIFLPPMLNNPFQQSSPPSLTLALPSLQVECRGVDPSPAQANTLSLSKYEQRRALKESNEALYIATLRALRDFCPVCFVMLNGTRCDDHDAPDCSIVDDIPTKFRRWCANAKLLPGSCFVCWAPRRSPTDPPGLRHGMPKDEEKCELLHLATYFCWSVYEDLDKRERLFEIRGLDPMDEDAYKLWLFKANVYYNFNFAEVVVRMYKHLEERSVR